MYYFHTLNNFNTIPMKLSNISLVIIIALLATSCISKKTLLAEKEKYKDLNNTFVMTESDLRKCKDDLDATNRKKMALQLEIDNLSKQNAFLKENNNTVISQLKDLSVISNTQAESIKKSLDNIGSKDNYIQTLQQSINRKDSLNMALVMNLKSALTDVNDKDVEVKVEKGVVFISISDKMLFVSGKFDVNAQAMTVLGKVAQVLNSRPEIEFMVEGHTDNVPYKSTCLLDNWDLSIKRSTAVVRILQNQFNINPKRMTAGGRGEYIPLQDNATHEGKAVNRRTRIIILPQLDQFFQLLEKKG